MNTLLSLMQIFALGIAGMCHALLGSIKVPLAKELKIDESRVGGLVSVFGFTLIPMAFAAGILADSWGRDTVIAIGCVLLMMSVVVLANVKSYQTALLSVLLLGTGWSALVNVLNSTQGPAFLAEADVSKDNLPYAMNLGDFIFGMGAFIMPMAVAYSLRTMGLKKTFLVFSVLIALPLVLSVSVDVDQFVTRFADLMTAGEESAVATTAAEQGLSDLLTDQFVILCCLAFFLHVPVEACVATWATTLMMDSGVKERDASIRLSAFWLTFTVSRLIAALTIPAGYDHAVVIGFAVTLVVVVAGLAMNRNPKAISTLVIIAGLILGPIFPILIAFLVGHVDVSVQGRAIGLFFCIGGVGWALVPFMVGRLADRSGLQKAFYVVAGCAVGLVLMCIALAMHGE